MHEHMTVVGVVGMPGSGKTAALEIIRTAMNGDIITMGDMVRREIRRQGLPLNASTLGSMAEELREKHGQDAVARLTIRYIQEKVEGSNLVIIDGIRSLHEVELFRNHWIMSVVGIFSPPATRHKRMMNRGRQDDEKTLKYCKERDMRELAFGIGNVIAMADAMIINDENTSVEKLREDILHVMRQILSTKATPR